MLRFFYTLILLVAQPFLWLFMLILSVRAPAYRQRLPERFGCYNQQSRPQAQGILLHAASVGEIIAATPLIKLLLEKYPQLAITVTTMTPTGAKQAKKVFGDKITHLYLPFDLPIYMKSLFNFVLPKICIVIETELWANFIHQLYLRQIPLIIANARLSPRSAQRYAWFKSGLQTMFNQISLIAAQDQTSAQRYLSLGVKPQSIAVTGNLKFDLNIDPNLSEKAQSLRQQWFPQDPPRQIWIAASTHEGEDELVLQAHKQLLQQYPDLLLILVPRHPERFNQVALKIEKAELTYVRRSQQQPNSKTQVLLVDSMGELMLFYGMANIAFIGGSLVPVGGHNPLEALAFHLPVITGQEYFNFLEIYQQLIAQQGALVIENSSEALFQALNNLLQNPSLQEMYAKIGYLTLLKNKGSLQRLLALLQPYLEGKND